MLFNGRMRFWSLFYNMHQTDVHLLHLLLQVLEIISCDFQELLHRIAMVRSFHRRRKSPLVEHVAGRVAAHLVVTNRLVDFDLDVEYLKHDFVDRFAHNLSLAIRGLARKPLKAAHEDVVFSDGLHEFLSVIRELVKDQVFHLVHAILFVELELICTNQDFCVPVGVVVLARKFLIILKIVAVTRRLLVNPSSFVLPFSVRATCINH